MNDRTNGHTADSHQAAQPAVSDFDLMAYVDGRLDPHRHRQVEAWLAARPDDAADIQTDIAITEAIRTLYNPVITEPVPERLEAALRGRSDRNPMRATRVAAMAASVLGAGFLGWWAGGQTQAPTGLAVDQRLLSQVTTAYLDEPQFDAAGDGSSGPVTVASAGDGNAAAVSALNDRMTFEVQAPDLTGLGYTMVGQRVAETGQGDIVEINYTDSAGERLALFMTTRWQESQPRFRAAQHNDVSTAYWYDGPLALALAGDAQPEVIRDLGISVHEVMKAGGLSSPALTHPAGTLPLEGEGAAPDDPPPVPVQVPEPPESAPATTTATTAGSVVPNMDAGQDPERIMVPDSVVSPMPVQQSDHEM
ncbi:hypothetical protein [Fodinicurvata sp. EGI_FJ10296]|uniref:anti-sigma factor family protein n=1 Tax=Fodinicurvata sp. EGI_FJ10296 TaxID=3231908 RepID=UPI003453B1F8